MSEPKKVTWEKCPMIINNRVRIVDKVTVTVYPDGRRAMSFDEYNRIIWSLYEKEKRERRQAEEKKRKETEK